jgi:hypothetical protein
MQKGRSRKRGLDRSILTFFGRTELRLGRESHRRDRRLAIRYRFKTFRESLGYVLQVCLSQIATDCRDPL